MIRAFSILFFVVSFLRSINSSAQQSDYATDKIPASLLKNANIVVRNYIKTVDIVSNKNVRSVDKYAITILNEKGYSYSKLSESYNRYITIERMSGQLYDKDGKKIKSFKTRDVRDNSATDDISLVDDERIKFYDFNYGGYPFTVEFEIEKTYTSTFVLPLWYPQFGYNSSVENANIVIEYPDDLPIKYKTFHIDTLPLLEKNTKGTHISLSIANREAVIKQDDLSPSELLPLPALWIACNTFKIENMNGQMDTWQTFGKFMYDLNANRDTLPDEIKKRVHILTDSCKTNDSKIKILYSYLQKNTRYVSIQLGIGGWQTFPAEFVSKKGYGDCKALSNYMKSLLKEAGITAYAAEVFAGEDNDKPMVTSFPAQQANHIIICAPLQNDTTWLECTSQDCPPGYLGSFTCDRNVLLITPDGGYIVKTPTYTLEDNLSKRTAILKIDSLDAVNGTIEMLYKGEMWDNEYRYIYNRPNSKVLTYLNTKLSLQSSRINTFKIDSAVEKKIPFLKETISLNGSAKITKNGGRTFLEIDFLKLTTKIPPHTEKRTKAFELKKSYQIADSFSIQLPGDYTAESIPEIINKRHSFGSFEYKVSLDKPNHITVTRYFTQNEGIYDSSLFADYVKFCKEVNLSQKEVVLLKKP